MKGFIDFLKQTNALALAIGVIIGGAVGKLVGSVVADIIMPLVSLAMPAGDWRAAKIILTRNPDGTVDKALGVGSLAGSAVDFVIIAFVVYIVGKSILKPAAAPAALAMKTCSDCTSNIPAAAKKCMHCGSAV